MDLAHAQRQRTLPFVVIQLVAEIANVALPQAVVCVEQILNYLIS